MFTIGYMDIYLKSQKADRQVEYRFVPKMYSPKYQATNLSIMTSLKAKTL